MATQLEQKLTHNPAICLTDTELESILGVIGNKKHGQIKRAIQKGDLIHLRRGLYCLSGHLTNKKPHPFALAQKIYWPSYISLESALSYHGLIPEAVYNVTSVTTKRAKTFNTPLGNFDYHKLPNKDFFMDVERIKENDYYFFMAKPWKAIADYIYCYKKDWKSLDALEQDLRIELEELPNLSLAEITRLDLFYKSKRVSRFLKSIKKELNL